MLGTTSYWDRLRLAYTFEIIKRTKSLKHRHGLSPEERKQALTQFEPGEIAHIQGQGGVYNAFYQTLVRNGYKLTKQELFQRRTHHRDAGSIGKYCLVLQRLNEREHVVCYITSFGNSIHGKDLSPVAKFFSLAMGDTPAWPPGHLQLNVVPGWTGGGFVFGVPVVRSGLCKINQFHRRFQAGWGELDRLKEFIVERMELFKRQHEMVRQAEVKYYRHKNLQQQQSTADEEMTRAVVKRFSQGVRGSNSIAASTEYESQKDTNETGLPSELAMEDLQETMLPVRPQPQRNLPRQRLPPIHLLECAEPHDLRWILRHMRHDIMHSSMYLNRLPHTTHVRRPVLLRLPPPLRYIRLPLQC